MSDREEVVKIEITRDEFIKNVIMNVLKSDLCDSSFSIMPSLMLFAVAFSANIWDKLVEYSRMKAVSDALDAMINKEEK